MSKAKNKVNPKAKTKFNWKRYLLISEGIAVLLLILAFSSLSTLKCVIHNPNIPGIVKPLYWLVLLVPQQPSENVEILGSENGITWGTATIIEFDPAQGWTDHWNLGVGRQSYSGAGDQTGYFYSGWGSLTPTQFANVVQRSPCQQDLSGITLEAKPGYTALDQISITEVSQLEFQQPNAIMFGTPQSSCYQGPVIFHQACHYGMIQPTKLSSPNASNSILEFRWWLGDSGVTNFSNIPQDF